MSEIRACVLGCADREGRSYRAAPGLMCCPRCSDRLRALLDEIERTYTEVTDVDQLIPGGHGDTGGGRRPPGPRSPAVDALIVHTDPRSVLDNGLAALTTVEQWTRLVREERSIDTPPAQMLATVPYGRVTMAREVATLRFNWDWIMGQPWVDEFAREMRDVLFALRAARLGADSDAIRVPCTAPILVIELPDGSDITLKCGARMTIRAEKSEVTCRNCGTVWPREKWPELGDPWAEYSVLADDYDVPVGTLWRWASEDKKLGMPWRTEKRRGTVFVHRDDVEAARERRREGKVVA